MPGFLSAYEGTERIHLDNGYWIDVKKCLSHAEIQKAQAKMGAGRQQVDTTGRQFATIDMNAYQTELLVQSIKDWNLDDNGEKWPLSPEPALRASVNRLPSSVSAELFEVCNRLNGPADRKQQGRFPDRPGSGGEEREAGPAGTPVVPDQESVLGGAGRDNGDDSSPPVA